MNDNRYDIFISYRRVDSEGRTSVRDIARTIKLEFDIVILPTVKCSKVFILFLSKNALLRCSTRGGLASIKSNSKIIPISPDNTFNGWPQDFPKELESLKRLQIFEASIDSLFEGSIKKLHKEKSFAFS